MHVINIAEVFSIFQFYYSSGLCDK